MVCMQHHRVYKKSLQSSSPKPYGKIRQARPSKALPEKNIEGFRDPEVRGSKC